MGFQHFKEVVHEAASRKGGEIRVSKGFGKNPELAREAGRKGGLQKHANRGKEPKPKEVDTSDAKTFVDELFANPEIAAVLKRLADE